jgi:hypothetical protein
MADKTIPQLPNLLPSGVTQDDLLVIVNYDVPTGTTKNIKALDLICNTCNKTNDVLYSGQEFSCLSLDSGMTLTQVIENIGYALCRFPNKNTSCYDLPLPITLPGSCQNPLDFVNNQSIISWCESLPPLVVCDGISAIDYVFEFAFNAYEAELNVPSIPCEGINLIDYLFETALNAYNENENIPLITCEGIDVIDYLFNFVLEAYDEQFITCNGADPFDFITDIVLESATEESCNINSSPLSYLFNDVITTWNNNEIP